jgi:YesN/AraC family two-component response regulator
MPMRVFIKNMVSLQCKNIVKNEIEQLGLQASCVDIGYADICEHPTVQQLQELDKMLHQSGLELVNNRKIILFEKIKKEVIEQIYHRDNPPALTFSSFLSTQLNYNYTYLSNLFKEVSGLTLEHYIMMHKIEKVKELLVYEGLTLTETANKLGYSSTAHLCMQFKKNTGLTPKQFMQQKERKFNSYDEL